MFLAQKQRVQLHCQSGLHFMFLVLNMVFDPYQKNRSKSRMCNNRQILIFFSLCITSYKCSRAILGQNKKNWISKKTANFMLQKIIKFHAFLREIFFFKISLIWSRKFFFSNFFLERSQFTSNCFPHCCGCLFSVFQCDFMHLVKNLIFLEIKLLPKFVNFQYVLKKCRKQILTVGAIKSCYIVPRVYSAILKPLRCV